MQCKEAANMGRSSRGRLQEDGRSSHTTPAVHTNLQAARHSSDVDRVAAKRSGAGCSMACQPGSLGISGGFGND
eukprot:354250-Chlamydomonas_euryale.AAC.3